MGCRLIILAVLIIVLLIGAAGAAMFHYLGWYSLLIIPVVAIVLFLIVRKFILRLLLLPFQLKGKVLKGARADIHEVRYLGVEEVNAGKDEKEKQYAYLVDLTIKPGTLVATPFRLWDPYELMPVAPDAPVSFDDDPTDGSFGSLVVVSVFENESWQSEGFDKLLGDARIRLKMHLLKPGPACKIRYYFYDVATVTLPPVSEA